MLNSQEARTTDENYTFDAVQPIAGINCDTSAAHSGDPVGQLQRDCPDIAYLKTVDGRPVTVNPNWGKAENVRQPAQFPVPAVAALRRRALVLGHAQEITTMKSIRNLWWLGVVAAVAACDPYDDERGGQPEILSVVASGGDSDGAAELSTPR